MATDETDDGSAEPGPLRTVVRTVTPGTGRRGDPEMDAIGWGLALGLVILLVPLLPLLIVVWLLVWLLGRLDPREEE